MKIFFLISSLFLSVIGTSQDSYHVDLIQFLSDNYNLGTPTFVISDNEVENDSRSYVYGSADKMTSSIDNFSFSQIAEVDVMAAGNNPWDSGYGIRNTVAVSTGDHVLITFWARKVSNNSELSFFAEDATTFDKEFLQALTLTQDWTRYFFPIKAVKNYAIDGLTMGAHHAAQIQTFQIAGFTALNYGPSVNLTDLPSTFSAGSYEGSEDDAAWRIDANQRIEELRKANLTINVLDADDKPVNDATVSIEMTKHDFSFGSAFVTCRFQGNNCYNPTYVEKITNLDGAGHGFNAGVTENAMKWDGWEEEWLGTPEDAVRAIKYLDNQGIKMRGHTLFWPGFDNMPEDIRSNQGNLTAIRSRIEERIQTMIEHPELKSMIRNWDILNEITTNRDLETVFNSDGTLTNGRDIYKEIYSRIQKLDPDLTTYINDYIVLSGGGSSSSIVNRYKGFIDELVAADVGLDGIGFQAHMGSPPTSIIKVEDTFNDFYDRYGLRMSVTEYDISEKVAEDVQAKYMADLLTLTFSHPAMDAFIMWGFWDGNHWKNNAPMFDINWNLKPGGQAFIDKVFGDWWTTEIAQSAEGIAAFRGFKGDYKVSVNKDNANYNGTVSMTSDTTITVRLDRTTAVEDVVDKMYKIYPNPTNEGKLYIDFLQSQNSIMIEVYSAEGRLVQTATALGNNRSLQLQVDPGVYLLHLISDEGTLVKRISVVE